jgi:hypothetical protein
MNTNTNTAVATTSAASTLPALRTRYNSAGKVMGSMQYFTGSLSAKEIKAQLKSGGLSGKALTKAVNETLRGEKDIRQQMLMAYVQAAHQNGFMADVSKANKKGNKLVIEMIKPEGKVSIAEVKDAIDSGAMSKEERDALLAILMGVEEEAKSE